MSQLSLELIVTAAKEVDGVEMGVLGDGTAYLTQRGLARMCGVDNRAIGLHTTAWTSGQTRNDKLERLITAQGHTGAQLFREVEGAGVKFYAYPERVCLAILEYYAFEAQERYRTEQAVRAYRSLARFGMREFIYQAVGYSPATTPMAPGWQNLQERMALNTVPTGYFSIFREGAEFILRGMQRGMPFDHHTVPDISVGMMWATHWKEQNLETTFGERVQHMHVYPDSYPQSGANPVDVWIYPDAALPEFRRWRDDVYVPDNLPKYLAGQVKKQALPASFVAPILEAAKPPVLQKLSRGLRTPPRLPPRKPK